MSKTRLSVIQRSILKVILDGGTLSVFNGRGGRVAILSLDTFMDGAHCVHLNSVTSLWRRKLIKRGAGSNYRRYFSLTDAGRKALEKQL